MTTVVSPPRRYHLLDSATDFRSVCSTFGRENEFFPFRTWIHFITGECIRRTPFASSIIRRHQARWAEFKWIVNFNFLTQNRLPFCAPLFFRIFLCMPVSRCRFDAQCYHTPISKCRMASYAVAPFNKIGIHLDSGAQWRTHFFFFGRPTPIALTERKIQLKIVTRSYFRLCIYAICRILRARAIELCII